MANDAAPSGRPLRTLCALLACLLLVAGCTGGGPGPDPGPDKRPPYEEVLGQPIQGVVAGRAGFTTTSEGRPVASFVANGVPAVFSLVDSLTGELLASRELEAGANVMASAFATSPTSGLIYFGDSTGTVYVVDADARTAEPVPTQPDGDPNFQIGAALPDGRVLFTSYPDAALRLYDPARDAWSVVARAGGDSMYLRGLAVVGETAYVGTATEDPHVLAIGLRDGSRRRLDPPGAPHTGFVQEIAASGGYLYVRVDENRTIYPYDLFRQRWLEPIAGSQRGLAAPPAGSAAAQAGRVYWLDEAGRLQRYDPGRGASERIGDWEGVGSFRGSGHQALPGGGEGLVTISTAGDILGVDPSTGRTTKTDTDAAGATKMIRSVGTASDGTVLAGGYATAPFVAGYDPDDGSWLRWDIRGQVEAFGSDAHGTVFGLYPTGELGFVPASGTGQDPDAVRTLGRIGHGQQRPVAILPLGGAEYAVASFPAFGRLGGALSIVNAESGRIDTYPGISRDQTVVSLARQGDRLLLGLGTGGGLGAEPTTEEAGVAVFDLTLRRVVERFVPVPGAQNVAALEVAPDGSVWGLTASTVFQLDGESLGVVRARTYDDYPDTAPYVRGRTLALADGYLWANMRGGLYRVDPHDLDRVPLAEGANATLAKDGNIYLSEGSTLKRWVTAGPPDGVG